MRRSTAAAGSNGTALVDAGPTRVGDGAEGAVASQWRTLRRRLHGPRRRRKSLLDLMDQRGRQLVALVDAIDGREFGLDGAGCCVRAVRRAQNAGADGAKDQETRGRYELLLE